MVCTDCLMIIANDDATGLNYAMSEENAAEREQEIRDAIADIQQTEGQIAMQGLRGRTATGTGAGVFGLFHTR